jgi:PadR family transcriptional regulator PadR
VASSERMTKQQRSVLQFLNGAQWVFGREIMKGTGLRSGTLYPAVARLTAKGLIEAQREVGDPHVLGRPLRIHYRLTVRGASMLPGSPRLTSAPLANSAGQ